MSRRNWFLFIFIGFLWGIPYLLIKVAVDELSPAVIVFSRVAIGSLILIPMAMRLGSLMPAIKAWRYVIPYAIGEMVGPWFLITAAEEKMSSGLAGLLVATVPIWATIIASMHGDKTVWQSKRLIGILVGFIGIVLVVGIESFSGRQSIVAIFHGFSCFNWVCLGGHNGYYKDSTYRTHFNKCSRNGLYDDCLSSILNPACTRENSIN
jgi:drug/metabolite transporter (DMT)-like permease